MTGKPRLETAVGGYPETLSRSGRKRGLHLPCAEFSRGRPISSTLECSLPPLWPYSGLFGQGPPLPGGPRTSTKSWRISSRSLRGPLGPLLDSGGPLARLAGLIDRHRLKPDAEDAAEGLEGVQARRGSAAHVADGIGATGGKQREAAVGDTGAADQFEEALPEARVRIRSTHVVSPTCTPAKPPAWNEAKEDSPAATPGLSVFVRAWFSVFEEGAMPPVCRSSVLLSTALRTLML